eukprot:CAMPEP_0117847616 /NCGR_PEP_ID=MMETSP0949-20121206/19847_1 /TAXON_ID=44440 /ORGANISM="Chattonella subsalsa, Strain CCMP2191" /LENGTH=435 /DNA_ID=CAMNT_0005694151 /DNA_START=80 /DNA_END=1388 /DNA_ORIENTATION=+
MGKKSKKKNGKKTKSKQPPKKESSDTKPQDNATVDPLSQNLDDIKISLTCDNEQDKDNSAGTDGGNDCEEEITGQDLLDCARYGELDNVKAVIEQYNIPVNFQDAQKNTALLYASCNGHLDVVKYLISQGAEFLENSSGNTPLHWASQNSQTEVVKFLTHHFQSIDVLKRNTFGKSALSDAFASGKTEIINEILEHPSANEEALMGSQGGGADDLNDECKDADKQEVSTENSIVHTFNFMEGAKNNSANEETEEAEGAKLVLIRELAIQNADSPFGETPDQDTPAKVYITDLNPVTLNNIDHNIHINSDYITDGCASSLALDWGNTETWPQEKVDIVIGSDLIYQNSTVSILQTVLGGILAENGEFLYVCPESGRDGLENFIATLSDVGFSLVKSELAPPSFKNNPLHDADDDECFLHFVDLQSTIYMLHEFCRI